ncbi:MAG: tRNA (adenine-N(1)-)-methyltransferase catalytic subunit trm61, partial [Pleopsidium flavum]
SRKRKRTGKVWSYEFHEQRVDKLKTEIREHGLDGIVQVEYRDVCQDGFLLSQKEQYSNGDAPGGPAAAIEPQADAIFLDLPAPWLALRHLTRSRVLPRTPDKVTETSATNGTDPGQRNDSSNPTMDDSRQYLDSVRSSDTGKLSFDSPLDPRTTVRLCTFSPCIEQVQRTISTLRQLGWLEIEMVEIAAKRVEIRRERVGLHEEGLQGVNASPASVTEAVKRLREIEGRFKSFHDDSSQPPANTEPKTVHSSASSLAANVSKQQRLGNIRDALPDRKLYKEGRLVHRAEQELKTHTSYLVFALLPREWMAEDEENCHQRWAPKAQIIAKDGVNMSRRQMKRAAKFRAGGNKVFEQMEEETTMTKSLDIPQNDQVDKAIEPLIDTTLFTA